MYRLIGVPFDLDSLDISRSPWQEYESADGPAARVRGEELQLGQLFVANGGDVR